MPQFNIPDEDVLALRKQGYTDEQIAQAQPYQEPAQPIGTLGTIGRTLKASAGGILGGGTGGLYGMEVGALAGAPLGPVGVAGGGIIGGIVGAGAGGLIGQKAQQAIEPEALYNQQQQEAQEAKAQNPKTALATEIIASALASGGKPSLDALRASEYLLGKVGKATMEEGAEEAGKKALIGTLMNAGVNPAINTGIGLATGQGLPSGTDLAAQVAGGAIFSRQAKWAERLMHGEPAKEVTNSNDQTTQQEEKPVQEMTTPFTKVDENGDFTIGGNRIKYLFLQKYAEHVKNITDPIAKAEAQTRNDNLKNTSIDDMRMKLHADAMAEKAKSILGMTDTDAGLKTAEEELPPIWKEPAAEVTNSPKSGKPNASSDNTDASGGSRTALAPVSANTLRITHNSFLPSDINRQETRPSTAVESELEAKHESKPTNDEPKSQAELEEEEFERKGYRFGKPAEDTNPDQTKQLLADAIRNGTDKGGQHTVKLGDALQFLISRGHKFSDVFRDMLRTKNLDLTTPIIHDPNIDPKVSAGEHRPDQNGGVGVIALPTNNLHDVDSILHEGIHALEHKVLPTAENGVTGMAYLDFLQKFIADKANNSHAREMSKAYLESAKQRGMWTKLFGKSGVAGEYAEAGQKAHEIGAGYGYGNVHEFSANKFDPDFQKILKGQKWGDENVWMHVLRSLQKFLGVHDGTMLGRMIESSKKVQRSSGQRTSEYSSRWSKGAGNKHDLSSIPDREPMLHGKRYAPPKPEQSHTPEEMHLPPDKYMSKFGAAFRSVIDKVRDIPSKSAGLLADSATQAVNKETELRGKWKNAIVQAGEGLSKVQKDRIMAAFNHELATKTSGLPLLRSAAERNFYNKARQLIDESGKYRLSIGEPITEAKTVNGKTIYAKRNLKQDEFYFPGMANQKVQQTYRNNTDHAAIDKLDKEFHDYNTKTLGLSESASQERIDNYKKSLQGSIKNSDISHQDYFNAHRKAQGTPLPPSFRETDPVRNLERYFDRAAIDASHYEFMEKNHNVLAALGQEKDAWNNKVVPEKGVSSLSNNSAVKAMLEHWKGEPVSPAEGNEQSISSLVSSAFISGPALELHKTVSNIVKTLSLSSDPIVLAKAVTHAMGNVMHGYNTAVENGVVKLTARSVSQMVDGNATAAERMQAAARVIRKVSTLNDLTTKVSTGLVQSMNEVIIPSKIARGAAGDITSQKFLKNLDPSYNPNKIYSPEEIKQLASRSANYIHGTGDIRSMPAWMLNDSEFSGFFSLAHWSIAQTNNFMKDVYEPALRGNVAPLITSIFGAAIGGYIIKELRQDIQGKKSTIPSLSEIANSDRGVEGNKGLVAYNMIAAMQFAGFGGLLSQLAKYPFDAAYKNAPQGATFPMDEVASDLATTLHQVSTAIANDPNVNWVDLAKAVTMHVMSTNFQLSRIAINQGINNGLITGLPAEKKELSDKMGQLRRFDMVEGLPYNEIDEASNPYMNLEQKKFKMEQDPQKAMQQLPSLVQNIMDTYKANPDVMMSKLKSLKENSYSTFPSMEQMPLSFMKYIGYLQREEGAEAAQKELQDYMKHKMVNEAKASVIP